MNYMYQTSSSISKYIVIWCLLLGVIFFIPDSPQITPPAVPISSFYITAVEIIIFGLIGSWIIFHLLTKQKFKTETLFGRYIFALLILYLCHIIIGLIRKDPILVLGDFRQYLPLIMYIPMVHIFNNKYALEFMRKIIFVVLLSTAMYICILFIFFNNYLIYLAIKSGNKILWNRIFFDNTLFLLFAYLGYLVLSSFDIFIPLKKRIFYVIIILSNAIMLLFIQCRSFWAMFGIILILSIFQLKTFIDKMKYVLLFIYSIFLIVSILYLMLNVFNYKPDVFIRIEKSVVDRALSFADFLKLTKKEKTISRSIGTVETRLQTVKRVMRDYVAPNWLFGIGLGGRIPMVNPAGEVVMWKYQIDNGYVTILAKYGVVGLFLYFLLTFKLIISLIRFIKSGKLSYDDEKLAKSFLIGLFAMAVGSLFSSIFVRVQPCIVGFVFLLCEVEKMNIMIKKEELQYE